MSPLAKSSADTEDKDLMLDKDMEKETWNFKSMADDDPMDFGFEPVVKNKKNAFKMDMGFDLDGDFGNLPSFKMDMPDFDFSSPSKKTTKIKESSDDKSSGDVKKNKDIFGFSYDFNGLDDFDLDSSLPRKGTETKTKTMDCEEIAAGKKTDKSDAFDFDLDLSPPEKGTETKTKTLDREEIAAGRKTDKSDALDIDLDSSVQKKGTTAKTKTMDHEEMSAGRKTEKSDALNFDLDLSPQKKGVETKTKTVGREEISAGRKFDKSDAMDFGLDLPMTRQAAFKAKTETDVKANASADTENQVSNTTDTMVVDNSTKSKQATPENRENPEALESPQSPKLDSSKTHMMHLQPQSVNTSPLKSSRPVIEEIDESLSNETEAFSPSHASEAAHTAGNRETSSDIHEMCRSGTKEDCPRDPDQNAYNKMVTSSESNYEKFEPEISYQLCLDKTEQQEEMGRDTQEEVQDQTRRTLRDPDTEHSQKNLSGKISSGTRPSQTAKVQDLSAKLPLAPSQSSMEKDTQEITLDQTRKTQRDLDAKHPPTSISGIIPSDSRSSRTSQIQDSNAKLQLAPLNSDPDRNHNDLKAMQTKDSGLIRSRFFKKPEQPESHVLKSSSARTESRPVDRVSSGIQDAIPGSGTRRRPLEPVNTDSEKIAENVNVGGSHEKKIIHEDNSNVKTVEHGAGLLDCSKMQAKNTTRERSMLQINISSKLDSSSLTQKLSKHLSSGVESLQKSKIVPLERPKLGNSMSDLRSEQTKRTIGVNKDQPSSAVQPELSSSINKESNTERPVLADSSAAKTQRASGVNKDQSISAVQPEVISSIRKERNTETPDKKSSEIHQLAPRDKSQILHFPSSLKRKALDEDVDRSLTPQLKRFSMSPRENRNVEELTNRLAQGKFSIQERRIENNTAKEPVNDNPRNKSHHQSINMANVEIPITESNDNVEKAEAYTKELEIICNILKKKHEEVKELLVRAVVNTNKLLMLNHPLYEDKIRMVQEFAAKLSLNEQQMMQT